MSLPVSFFFKPPPSDESIGHRRAEESGESPVDYFKRVVALDETSDAWLVKYLEDLAVPTRNRFREALDKRALQAGQDVLMHELAPLAEWSERLHDMANQLEGVRELAETTAQRRPGDGS